MSNNTMDNQKKYRLLKDLPDAKAGTELVFDGMEAYDYISEGIEGNLPNPSWYKREFVENNPEWFEEIKDTPVEVEHKKIEANVSGASWQSDKAGMLVVNLGESYISEDKFPAIKKAIEEIINPPASTPAPPPKEYEILSYLFNLGGQDIEVKKENTLWGQCVQMKSPILSVKRLSDGEVFRDKEVVGDIDGRHATIYGFQEKRDWDGGVRVYTHKEKIHGLALSVIKKLPPQEKKPLFTTEDGKGIFEGDEYWYVNYGKVNDTYKMVGGPFKCAYANAITDYEMCLNFSTKEAADEYVLLNQPIYSVWDAWQFLCVYIPLEVRDTAITAFKENAKSKQSKTK